MGPPLNPEGLLARLLGYVTKVYECSVCGRAVRRCQRVRERSFGRRGTESVAFETDGAVLHHCGRAERPYHAAELVKGILEAHGQVASCKGDDCRKTIYWVPAKTPGKRQCFEEDGEVHWARCPNARDFQRKYRKGRS